MDKFKNEHFISEYCIYRWNLLIISVHRPGYILPKWRIQSIATAEIHEQRVLKQWNDTAWLGCLVLKNSL